MKNELNVKAKLEELEQVKGIQDPEKRLEDLLALIRDSSLTNEEKRLWFEGFGEAYTYQFDQLCNQLMNNFEEVKNEEISEETVRPLAQQFEDLINEQIRKTNSYFERARRFLGEDFAHQISRTEERIRGGLEGLGNYIISMPIQLRQPEESQEEQPGIDQPEQPELRTEQAQVVNREEHVQPEELQEEQPRVEQVQPIVQQIAPREEEARARLEDRVEGVVQQQETVREQPRTREHARASIWDWLYNRVDSVAPSFESEIDRGFYIYTQIENKAREFEYDLPENIKNLNEKLKNLKLRRIILDEAYNGGGIGVKTYRNGIKNLEDYAQTYLKILGKAGKSLEEINLENITTASPTSIIEKGFECIGHAVGYASYAVGFALGFVLGGVFGPITG